MLSLRFLPLAAALLLAVACVAPAASPAPNPAGDYGLVWEAWERIQSHYVNADQLNQPQAIATALEAVASSTDTPPYPFLTEVGKLRGQPPAEVPPGLGDLWRGLTLHRQQHPDVSDETRVRAAIAGLVASVGDPVAGYVASADYGNASEGQSGVYEGIGANVRMEDDAVVVSPRDGSPAQRAGLREGDVLLEVNGDPVEGKTLDAVVSQVRGPAGTKVRLLVLHRGDPEPAEYEVFRGSIDLDSIEYQLLPGGIAYIYIDRFRENTGQQVIDALENMKRYEPLALIVDLRGNPGGSPDGAQATLAQLIPPGSPLLIEEDKNGARRDWRAPSSDSGLFADQRPMAALVNGGTAGLAEAAAAALQDSRRAAIIGERTFGKGTSNSLVRLSDGSALYLPTARWVRPSGETLDGLGVTPDIWVSLERDAQGVALDSQLSAALRHLDAQLPPFR